MGDVLLPEIDDNLKAVDTAPEELEREEAVRSPGSLPGLPIPVMVVDFDAMELRPSGIVQAVRGRGLHAEMIGF